MIEIQFLARNFCTYYNFQPLFQSAQHYENSEVQNTGGLTKHIRIRILEDAIQFPLD